MQRQLTRVFRARRSRTTLPLRDPQLRHYAKLPTGSGGVYVTEVVPEQSGREGGFESPGDVLHRSGGHAPIDQDGNYEEPLYGRIAFVNLITTKAYAGDKAAASSHLP